MTCVSCNIGIFSCIITIVVVPATAGLKTTPPKPPAQKSKANCISNISVSHQLVGLLPSGPAVHHNHLSDDLCQKSSIPGRTVIPEIQ